MKLLAATLLFTAALALALDTTRDVSATAPEKTIILRVTSAEPGKPVTFSGSYQFDSGGVVQLEDHPTPFGVMMKARSLRATLRKHSGSPKLYVEVLEYTGEKETGSMTGPGNSFEIEDYAGNGTARFDSRQ
ncbi:MAG TPA: hypothetical protein VK421_17190 [Pyrinomonadaceae bacterium]|nr:hypothetical protein [Pyrinomonadaceae bacterium]